MPPWDPEHPVDAALATLLAASAMPDLVGPPRHLGAGWDVDVWAFDSPAGPIAVRFPRRAAGRDCLDNELRVLPHVAPLVPAPVPVPLAIADASPDYPSRFYAHALLPGAPAIRADLDDPALQALASPLGAFLRALHAIPRFPGLADDTRGDSARIAERALPRLTTLSPSDAARAEAILRAPPPTDVAPVLDHGDFHAGNLLLDDDGALTAVIDWGDCALGDPAIDLSIAWSLLPPAARGDFLAAYGDVSPPTWARARLNALARHGLALLAWSRDRADPIIEHHALASIARILSPR